MVKYLDLVGISSSLKWENFEYSVVGSGKYFSRSKFYDAVITENLWDSRTCANNFCIRFRHNWSINSMPLDFVTSEKGKRLLKERNHLYVKERGVIGDPVTAWLRFECAPTLRARFCAACGCHASFWPADGYRILDCQWRPLASSVWLLRRQLYWPTNAWRRQS